MREGIGGTILFYIILGFLALFIVFIAIIMNYASAYRTNNYVVNMVEQYEGKVTHDDLKVFLANNRYYNDLDVSCNMNDKGAVFHITTYIYFELPILDFGMPIAINNDTKTIYTIKSCSEAYSCNGNKCD